MALVRSGDEGDRGACHPLRGPGPGGACARSGDREAAERRGRPDERARWPTSCAAPRPSRKRRSRGRPTRQRTRQTAGGSPRLPSRATLSADAGTLARGRSQGPGTGGLSGARIHEPSIADLLFPAINFIIFALVLALRDRSASSSGADRAPARGPPPEARQARVEQLRAAHATSTPPGVGRLRSDLP